MTRELGGLVAWFAGGLVVGVLASIGAFVGGLLFGAVLPGHAASWIGGAVVIGLGAVGLLAWLRGTAPRRRFGLEAAPTDSINA